MEIDSWLAASDGDASGLWLTSLIADAFFPGEFVWGEFASAARLDAQQARDYFSSGEALDSSLARAATAFGWGGGRLIDAWPALPDEDEYADVRTSNVETLLIGGEVDVATPPQWATRDLLPQLPNGTQLVLPGYGHSTSFWLDQPEAGTRLIVAYLDSGQVDDSLYEPQRVDFTPEVTQVALGKGIGGGMVGFAVLTVLSLLLDGGAPEASLRAQEERTDALALSGRARSGRLVRRRSAHRHDDAETPLDDQWLATLGVGLPVGLGIYYAWLNRACRSASRPSAW